MFDTTTPAITPTMAAVPTTIAAVEPAIAPVAVVAPAVVPAAGTGGVTASAKVDMESDRTRPAHTIDLRIMTILPWSGTEILGASGRMLN